MCNIRIIVLVAFLTLARLTLTRASSDESNEVKNITTVLPLTFIGFILGTGTAKLINTGHSVETVLIAPITTKIAFGGPLGFNLYIYSRTKYYWANDLKESAYQTVDGNSTPLVVSIIFHNFKYGSYHNALNHPDGIFEILFQISIGSIHNLPFDIFAAALKKIRKPNQSVKVTLLEQLAWYELFPPYLPYTAYPGAITDESTGKVHYCTTTVIVRPNLLQSISKKQFQESFLQLVGSDGKQLTNQKSEVLVGQGPIIGSTGVIPLPIPFAIPFPSNA